MPKRKCNLYLVKHKPSAAFYIIFLCSFLLSILSLHQMKNQRVLNIVLTKVWREMSQFRKPYLFWVFFFFALSFSCFTKRVAQNLFRNCLISLRIRVSCVAWETALGKPKKKKPTPHLVWYKNVDLENYTFISLAF